MNQRMVALVALIGVFSPGEALAHADGMAIGPNEVWHHWNFDPWILCALLLGHWLYGHGVLRAWRRAGRNRIVPGWRVACFLGGEALIIAALISPIDPLGETLLAAHMMQHILLTTLAPILLVLGAPVTAWMWALPASWRPLLGAPAVRALATVVERITRPLAATLLHAAALWAWHVPTAFQAALQDETLHTLEHLSFFATALMFWTAMFDRRTPPAIGAMFVASTFVQSGLLGAVLSLARWPIYPDYGDRAMLWNLSPLVDQQIAGLLMWAPAGLVYFAVFLALAARVFGNESRARVSA